MRPAPDPRPTAIVHDDDVMAVAGPQAATALGLRVPGDLSVLARASTGPAPS